MLRNRYLKKVLDDFEEILLMESSLEIREIKKTKYSIQFIVDQFEFDILPAPNFVTRETTAQDKYRLQRERALERIKRDPETYSYMYSGALAQASIDFMKHQDEYTHLARIQI